MRLNTQWLGNGKWCSTRCCCLYLTSFRSACECNTDQHDQPRYAEPGEQVADRGIDRMHALHGDVGHHPMGIAGKEVRSSKHMSFVVYRHRKPMAGLAHQGEAILNRAKRRHLGMVRVNLSPVITGHEQHVVSRLPGLAARAGEVGIETNHIGQPPIRCLDGGHVAISWWERLPRN